MSNSELQIEREQTDNSGRYVIRMHDGAEAEMTYRKTGSHTVAFDHTYVPPQHRGGSIALDLVERGIADARAEGMKVAPLCSYVALQFRRHPDWTDLLAN
jgi:hypothetical protein